MRYITKTVWVLSIVSLFTDTASEMLYPVMPIYLKTIGFSVFLIGILEGLAEATAGLSKGYFGKLSDVGGKRVPFVRWGYLLSALSKPMMAMMAYPLWIFLSRTMDRLGKGIRTGARDALLSDEATPETKGRVFGLHRAMDTLGAVIGPSFALLYLLYFHPEDYRSLFFIALLPGLLAVVTTFFLKERAKEASRPKERVRFLSFLSYWRDSPVNYRKLVAGLLVFTLFNSSDVFLLLKVKQSGLNDSAVIGVYIFYNLVYALFSLPAGMLADKLGLNRVFIGGLVLFALVYWGMAVSHQLHFYILLFFLYGIYASATEGIAKAWITNISEKKDAATAIGFYTGMQSICALLASSLAGFIWMVWGAQMTFIITGLAAFAVAIYLMSVPRPAYDN